MCGICGYVGYREGLTYVKRMALALRHRGPDSEGYFNFAQYFLGMRRLRIIDLKTGDQPIYNEDNNISIVFNGEIYNYNDIAIRLQHFGHVFRTESDTEVILHAYEEWGVDCIEQLRGMFVFAIVDYRDLNNPFLFIARDRLGIKPLYIWKGEKELLFSSEVRSLLSTGIIKRQLSPAGLYTYLTFGSVQEPLTLIDEIYSLAPASWIIVKQDGGLISYQNKQYWQPPQIKDTIPLSNQVRKWLTDAVNVHLRSDVPLGAFLSGGLDSGAIVALAAQSHNSDLRTFTLMFDNWLQDERELARTTARRYKTKHHERLVKPEEVLGELPHAISSMDQPSVDGINTWYVSREARLSGLVVSLSGVGGDELFAGYQGFVQIPMLKSLSKNFPFLVDHDIFEKLFSHLPGKIDTLRKLGAYIDGNVQIKHPYFIQRSLFTQTQVNDLIRSDYRYGLSEHNHPLCQWLQFVNQQISTANQYDPVNEVSWLELSQYMLSTLLRDTDMMSMAHSLEVRVPFVDHILIENILPISGELKFDKSQTKPLLVNALEGLLPQDILRRTKRTFTFPFQEWLLKDLRVRVEESLTCEQGTLNTWANPRSVANVWRNFLIGRTNWARPWALFILSDWLVRNEVSG